MKVGNDWQWFKQCKKHSKSQPVIRSNWDGLQSGREQRRNTSHANRLISNEILNGLSKSSGIKGNENRGHAAGRLWVRTPFTCSDLIWDQDGELKAKSLELHKGRNKFWAKLTRAVVSKNEELSILHWSKGDRGYPSHLKKGYPVYRYFIPPPHGGWLWMTKAALRESLWSGSKNT